MIPSTISTKTAFTRVLDYVVEHGYSQLTEPSAYASEDDYNTDLAWAVEEAAANLGIDVFDPEDRSTLYGWAAAVIPPYEPEEE